MPVSVSEGIKEYTSTGSAGPFQFEDKFFKDTDLSIWVTIGSGYPSLKTLNTDYTVSGAGSEDGGSFTFLSGHIPESGAFIQCIRDIPEEHEPDYEEGGTFPASTITNDFDAACMMIQQHSRKITRAIRFPDTDAIGINAILPKKSDRANKYLYFNGNGEPTATVFAGTPEAITDKSLTPAKWEDIPGDRLLGRIYDTGDILYLTKAQVLKLLTLDSVNNTADLDKPISNPTATALAARLLAANNLSDLESVAAARANLGLATVASSGSYNDLSNKLTAGTNISIASNVLSTTLRQRAFFAYHTSGVSSGSDIKFGSTLYNYFSLYNTANGRFTADIAGVYHFEATWNNASIAAGNRYGIEFYKNGSLFKRKSQLVPDGNSYQDSVGCDIPLTANDYVTVQYIYAGTYNASYPYNLSFSGFLAYTV